MIDSVSNLNASKHESSVGPQGQGGQKGGNRVFLQTSGAAGGVGVLQISSLAGSGRSYVEFAGSPLYLRGFPNGASAPTHSRKTFMFVNY